MKHHQYCKHVFGITNANNLKLSGSFWNRGGGYTEAHVYDFNRIRVFSSNSACCVSSAKTEYLKYLDGLEGNEREMAITVAERTFNKMKSDLMITISQMPNPQERKMFYTKLMKISE